WEQRIVSPSNIGRPTILALGPERSLFCAARGDNRPPEDGVEWAMLDTRPEATDAARVIWRRLVAASDREKKVFMNQPVLAALGDGKVALQVVEAQGQGRRKNAKGTSRTHLYTLFPNDVGPNPLFVISEVGAASTGWFMNT